MYKKIVFVGVLLAGMSAGAMELSREVDEPQVIMYVGEEQNEILLPMKYAELMGILELVDDPAFSDKFRFQEVTLIGWKIIAGYLERLYEITQNPANADTLRQEIFTALSELESTDLKEVIFAADYLQIPRLLEIAFKGTDKDKCPLLHWAAQKGRLEVVKLLVGRSDVEVNATDPHGSTPLHLAAFFGHVEVVKLLLGRDDLEVNAEDSDGDTPLLCAAEKGQVEVVKLLLDRDDVKVNAVDHFGSTPLHWAARRGHVAVAKLLLGRNDILVNTANSIGSTPLYYAAFHRQRNMCLYLLTYGLITKENCARDAQDILTECTPLLNDIYSKLKENNPVRALFSESNRGEILEMLKQGLADSDSLKPNINNDNCNK